MWGSVAPDFDGDAGLLSRLSPAPNQYYEPFSVLIGLELDGVPSFSTFRQTMLEIDLKRLSNAFEMWILQHPEWLSLCAIAVAINGKRIRQPIETQVGKQRLTGLVSLFASQAGISLKPQVLTEEDIREIKSALCSSVSSWIDLSS